MLEPSQYVIISVSKVEAVGEEFTNSLTLRVTDEQEAALEAFFQINNWVLIKEGMAETLEII